MIKGITDSCSFRRDGTIRAGLPKKGKRVGENDNRFHLRDAPQLIPILGENPNEIYFTVYWDHMEACIPSDLRYYVASELVCQSTHELGDVAAYHQNGDVAGVFQEPHPRIPRARMRRCQHKRCPDYISNKCSETMRIEMVIPQYSMASLFTLWTRSINLILDADSCFKKTAIQTAGKLSGQIFRAYKLVKDMPYENVKTGVKGKSPKDVISVEFIPFEAYEAKFRKNISDETWEALLALRGRHVANTKPLELNAAPEPAKPVDPSKSIGAVARLTADPAAEDVVVKERANHEAVIPLFQELGKLLGKNPVEAIRIATARNFSDVGKLTNYLKGKIAEEKKKVTAVVKDKARAIAAPNKPISAKDVTTKVVPAKDVDSKGVTARAVSHNVQKKPTTMQTDQGLL